MIRQDDLISIIVPVYNMEQYLDRCMDSILNQTYENLEIILVDDGSVDKSSLMCDEYAKKDPRIKVVHKVNGGLSDARNAGLDVATGAYIGYVDSDDWIEPDMYEKMYQACIEYNAQVAVCRYAQVYRDKTVKNDTDNVVAFDKQKLLGYYICDSDDYKIYNSVWSKLFKRELVDGVKFPVGKNSEDIMYTTKAFCKADKGVYIDKCLYNYVLDREGSIMNVKRAERMFDDELPFWREHIDYIRRCVSDKMGDYAAYYYYKRLLFYYLEWEKEPRNKRQKCDKRIAAELKRDSAHIQKIYENDFVAAGDKARMKLALFSPKVYGCVTRIYDKLVVPVKAAIKK